jgi:hypothetical protein
MACFARFCGGEAVAFDSRLGGFAGDMIFSANL